MFGWLMCRPFRQFVMFVLRVLAAHRIRYIITRASDEHTQLLFTTFGTKSLTVSLIVLFFFSLPFLLGCAGKQHKELHHR